MASGEGVSGEPAPADPRSTAASTTAERLRPWALAAFSAGALVALLLAIAATIELLYQLGEIALNFPGQPGLRGLLAVALLGALAAAGVWLVLRLPVRWALLLGALLLVVSRTAAAIFISPELVRDPSAYHRLALGLLEGECCLLGDPDELISRPMGYPILLAAFYGVGLDGKMLNLSAALLAGPLVWALADRLAGPRTAVVALYLYATAPALALITGVLLTETVYLALILASLWAATSTAPFAGGALLGLAQYVRATTLVLAPVFLLPLVVKRAWRQVVLFIAVFLLALAPVIVTSGGLSTSGMGGWSLLTGTSPERDGRYSPAEAERYRAWGPERERLAREEAFRRVVADPIGFASLAVHKVRIMWAQEHYGAQFALVDAGAPGVVSASARLLSQLHYAAVFMLAGLALWRVRRAPPLLAGLMLAVLLTVFGLHLFVEVQARYHAYLVPLLIVLAAWRIAPPATRERLRQRPR